MFSRRRRAIKNLRKNMNNRYRQISRTLFDHGVPTFHFSEDINNAYRHFCGRSIGVEINKIHRL